MLILFAAHPLSAADVSKVDAILLAEKARTILHDNCAKCHTKETAATGGFALLPGGGFVRSKDRPDAKEILQLIESGSEPRGTGSKVSEADRKILKEWEVAGAAPYADVTSDEYARRQVLLDMRSGDHSGDRYFAFNHLYGPPDANSETFREALALALNLLSWKPQFAYPKAIDPTGTIFRVHLADLGWDAKPYPGLPINLFDLVLLEYPHGVIPANSPAFDELMSQYIAPGKPGDRLRPVPFVRGDWFIAEAGRSPLYEDLLRLPVTLPTLEKKLGLAAGKTEHRAGVKMSDVLKYSRIVERRTTPDRIFWRTFDLRAVTAEAALVDEAGKDQKLGGEVLFSLPNGLPGFFIAGEDGHRFPEVPSQMLDRAKVKGTPLRNGFACLQCHKPGLKSFTSVGIGDKLKGWVFDDNGRYDMALARLPVKTEGTDLLAVVADMYRKRGSALNMEVGDVRIPPLDGLTHFEQKRFDKPLSVEMASFNKLKEKTSVFKQGEGMYLVWKNTSDVDIWIQLISITDSGEIFPIPLAEKEDCVKVPARKELRYPGDEKTLPVGEGLGKNTVSAFISDEPITGAKILQMIVPKDMTVADLPDYVSARFVHMNPRPGQAAATFGRIEKRTIEIETVAKDK